jgi:hypothetical protein
VKINALLIALLLGASSLVPVQAATHKKGTTQAAHHSKTKRVKHSKKRAHSSKTSKTRKS